MARYVEAFEDIDAKDKNLVGGKNANLGELLNKAKVPVPSGYVVTTEAYNEFIDENKLHRKIKNKVKELKDPDDTKQLQRVGDEIRKMIEENVEKIRNELVDLNRKGATKQDLVDFIYGSNTSMRKTDIKAVFKAIDKVSRTGLSNRNLARVLSVFSTDLNITTTEKILSEIRKRSKEVSK